jgi:hypothetical protein
MKKKIFKVNVTKVVYYSCDLEVEADNEIEAMTLAEETAPDVADDDWNLYDIDFDSDIFYEYDEHDVKFDYDGESHSVVVCPSESDWWMSFESHGHSFDVHYFEEDDKKEILVYKSVYEDGVWNRLYQPIYTQTL